MLTILIWLVNFGISWLNAFSVGNVWDASKAKGGLALFMSWMGAILAASGFTWCMMLPLGFLGSRIPMQIFADVDKGEVLPGMLFDPTTLEAFYELGYMVIIFPILGSGLSLTVMAWRSLALRRAKGEAGVQDYAIAGWNTFAQVQNTYSAVRLIPGVLDNLEGFFSASSKGSSKSKKGSEIVMIAVLAGVVVAVIGGVLITYSIIQSRRRVLLVSQRGW